MKYMESRHIKFQTGNREGFLRKKWGSLYMGNPVDKLSESFEMEFEKGYFLKQHVNGVTLYFVTYPFTEGGGYGFGIGFPATTTGGKQANSKMQCIWVSNDAEYAYPFFDTMKRLALLEPNPEKLFSIGQTIAFAVLNGVKKKDLSSDDLLEIRILKNKLGQLVQHAKAI